MPKKTFRKKGHNKRRTVSKKREGGGIFKKTILEQKLKLVKESEIRILNILKNANENDKAKYNSELSKIKELTKQINEELKNLNTEELTDSQKAKKINRIASLSQMKSSHLKTIENRLSQQPKPPTNQTPMSRIFSFFIKSSPKSKSK